MYVIYEQYNPLCVATERHMIHCNQQILHGSWTGFIVKYLVFSLLYDHLFIAEGNYCI